MKELHMTHKEARDILTIAKEKGIPGRSIVNPGLTKQQVWDILWYPAEIYPDNEEIRYQSVIRNILREFK